MAGSPETRARIGFLEMLDAGDRADLTALGQGRRFRPGQPLMRQGDASDTVIVVLEGQVKISLDTADGRTVVVAVHGPRDVIGEFEAIGDFPTRVASVIALDAVSARVLTRQAFIDYLLKHPAASLALVRVMVRRLDVADRRRIDATAADASHALARFLIELADGAPLGDFQAVDVAVPLAQHDLASLIGVSRNSVVRALGALRSRGFITTARRTIRIVDAPALRQYVETGLPPGSKG